MTPFAENLKLLFRAQYPLLYVVTWEEERALADIAAAAEEEGREAYTWSPAGRKLRLLNPSYVETFANDGEEVDPLEAINRLVDSDGELVYVFCDSHHLMNSREVEILRRLREFASLTRARADYKCLIVVSPVLNLPPELTKTVTVLDYPLPGTEELGRLITDIQDSVEQGGLPASSKEQLVKAALGLTLSEAERVFWLAVKKNHSLTEQEISVILQEKKQIIRKSGYLEYVGGKDNFKDIGGLDELKKWLRSRRDGFTEQARLFGVPEPRGVLLIGVPGCGKSLCAKAIAAEWDQPLLRLDIGSLFSSWVGSSEANLRKAIAVAEAIAPAVLWVDEIEKGFAGAGRGESDGGTAGRVFASFLTWMQEKLRPVFVVATANDITRLPPELLRKGRFDEIFFVDLPDAADRTLIFEIHLRKRIGEERYTQEANRGLDVQKLADLCEDLSGAEIEQVVIEGLFEAFAARSDAQALSLMQRLQAAASRAVPLALTAERTVDGLRRWAELRTRPAAGKPASDVAVLPETREDLVRVPFKFDDGSTAVSLQAFYGAVVQRRDELVRDLYNPRLESWLRTNGFEDLARAASRIRSDISNREYGIEEFLMLLKRGRIAAASAT